MKISLSKNEIESFKKESLTRATVRDIRKCMDEIRINGLTDAGKGSGDKRLKDLLCLLGLYEDKLEKDDLYDDARTVDKAVEYLRAGNTDEWMFGLDECRYIFLSGDRFSPGKESLWSFWHRSPVTLLQRFLISRNLLKPISMHHTLYTAAMVSPMK